LIFRGGVSIATLFCRQTRKSKDMLILGDGQDIRVRDGMISELGRLSPSEGERVIDARGKLVTYGLCDVHVHFRQPGRPDKETIRSGSLAAARGGYTLVCPMPNLDPVPDSPETLRQEASMIESDAVVDVRPYAAITAARLGKEVVDMRSLKPFVAGFSDDGCGVQDESVIRKAMELAAENDCVIAEHCEDEGREDSAEREWRMVQRDVRLAEETGCRYHVCHVSTKESVAAIRKAKERGARVSCETAPHYLTLTCEDVRDDGRFRMNPPLRTQEDRKALLEGLADGTVEVIATDHAPHTAEEKGKGFARSLNGIVGLETAFPVLYSRLVECGVLSERKLLELMCDNPRRLFSLGGGMSVGESADIAVFDTKERYRIDSRSFLSKGRSTPFEGWEVTGRCITTIYKGKAII